MKRFFLALALVFCVLGVLLVYVPQPFAKLVSRFPQSARVTIFCRQASCEATDVGNGFLVRCSVENFEQTLRRCGNVDGISIRFFGTEQTFEQVVSRLNIKAFRRQNLGELTVVCGYSRAISGEILLDGARVNVQAAFDGTTVTVGSPLILDEY